MTRIINNKTNSSGNKSSKQHFYILSFVVIFLAPIILIFLYDWLAGGVFNGLAGSWKEPIINPDIFLMAINPIVFILLYILLVKHFRIYFDQNSQNLTKKVLAIVVLLIATATVMFGIFWKTLTA